MKTFRKLLAPVLFTTVMLVTGFFTASLFGLMDGTKMAQASTTKTSTEIEFTDKVEDFVAEPGETLHIKLPVRSRNTTIVDPKIIIETEGMPFTASNISITDNFNTIKSISTAGTYYIEFDLKFKETAKIGKYKLAVKAEYSGYDDNLNKVIIETSLPLVYTIIEREKEDVQLTVDNISLPDAVKGGESELTFVIKNEGELTAKNTYFSVGGYEEAGIIPKYSKLSQEVGKDGVLKAGESMYVKLPVGIASTATSGTKTITVDFTYKNIDGEPKTGSKKIYVNIENNESAPKLEIESVKFANELKAGDKFNLVVTLRNVGASRANDTKITLDGLGVTSFIQNYTSEAISGGDIDVNKKLDVKIPLIVSKEATAGLKKLDIKVSYKDGGKVDYATNTSTYINVEAAEGVNADGKPNVVINNVSQNPSSPIAGEKVSISFDIENKSKIDISELKLSLGTLASNTFSPVNLEPYQYIEKIKGEEKVRITLPLNISDNIQEGVNNIEVKLNYKDKSGKIVEDSAILYILDIEANEAASKPKLLISNFSTDVEQLRAGSVFTFNYDIKNTHHNINATNIKVTIVQAEGIFSVTKGSNTSYITKISAGESVSSSIELKVKADAATKSYPLEVSIEYEYEGAEPNPTTGQVGELVKETINLQATENSRPVVDNIAVGYGDMPIVNQPTPLMFEFYNMGKSRLNNVRVKIEGDYTLNTGGMYFIGNVEAGSSEYAELEIMPNIEGEAKGKLILTFEDSNGDEVSVEKDFESMIQGDTTVQLEPGFDPNMTTPIEPSVKKEILPLWAFILLQIVILAIIPLVTKVIGLQLYRKKLRKKENSENL